MYSSQYPPPSRLPKHLVAAALTTAVLGTIPVVIEYSAVYRTGHVQDGWLYFSLFCSCMLQAFVTLLCITLPMWAAEKMFRRFNYWPWLAVPFASVATAAAEASSPSMTGYGNGYGFGAAIKQTIWYGVIGSVVYAATLNYVQWRHNEIDRSAQSKEVKAD